MEDSRGCAIHFYIENVGKKRDRIRKAGGEGGKESETHASSFFIGVGGEDAEFKGRLLLLLSSV